MNFDLRRIRLRLSSTLVTPYQGLFHHLAVSFGIFGGLKASVEQVLPWDLLPIHFVGLNILLATLTPSVSTV